MADKKQLARLKEGKYVWNRWRAENLDMPIDLSEADLHGADLGDTDLRKAYLFNANVSAANLSEADLSEADFRFADLRAANLVEANLSGADLRGADLRGANLRGADLAVADLSRANLVEANLRGAILREADLREADLSQCFFGHTVIGDVDLSATKGLESVMHQFPSTIGIDTIYKSKGNIPELFLRGAGVPENFITFMHSLTGKAFDFFSCFISHSAKDKPFCERLLSDLQAKGVRTWYFPEDAKWGETVWGEIDRGIKIYDKLVVVLSDNSLLSKPVLREIERSLNREDKEHKNILFPIRLDDYIFNKWEHERKADVLEKVLGDFSDWDKDAAKYGKAFDKLLKGLQAES
jgi:hypothetical protein